MGTPVSSGNRGVMALGASLVRLCKEAGATEIVMFVGHHGPCEIAFRVGEKEVPVRVVNYRLSPLVRPCEHLAWILLACLCYRGITLRRVREWLRRQTPWIGALQDMTFVGDIRGGDSFSDIYGWQRFLTGFLASWTVVLVKGGLVHFPQTYGPYQRRWARWLARYLLKRSPFILARDRESQRVAQELVGTDREVWLSPDVAFALEGALPEQIELWPASDPAQRFSGGRGDDGLKPIGINVNGLMYNGGYTRNNMFGLKLDYVAMLPELVKRLLELHPGEVWLIPHTYGPPESVENDPEACRRVRESLPEPLRGRVRLVVGEYDCCKIKGVIGQCDFFIGSRMHACIAALSQGIPTVGIAYSRKFSGVFQSIGVPEWVVDGRTTADGEAIGRVLALYRQREYVRGYLGREAEAARTRLKELFGELVRRIVPEAKHPQAEAAVTR